MHFLAIVLLPKETTDREEAIASLMIPHLVEVGSGGPPRKEYIAPEVLRYWASQCGVRPSDLEKLAAKVNKKFHKSWQVDEGEIFHMTNLIVNPNGKLDYWKGIDLWRFPGLESDVWPVSAMPRDLLPYAIITPEGAWHEAEAPGPPKWWKALLCGPRAWFDLTKKDKQAIRQWAYGLLDQHPTCLAVALDCHR